MNERKRKLVSYHECGHAIVGALMPEYDPVSKISIVPRGAAGGLTFFAPRWAAWQKICFSSFRETAVPPPLQALWCQGKQLHHLCPKSCGADGIALATAS